MNIGIVEIYSHHVFAYTLAAVAAHGGANVTIYTSRRIYNDLEPLLQENPDNIKCVVANEGESDWKFLKRVKSSMEQSLDVVFFNSVQGYRIGLFYLFNPKIKTIVGAGRISEFFGIKYKLFGHASIRRFLHHNYTRFFLQRCIPRYEALIVHTDQAREFALKHGYKKQLIQMPFSLYKGGVQLKNDKSQTRFVITGSINETCRDHLGTLDAFEKLWQSGDTNGHLTVLSGTSGSQHKSIVLKRMKELKQKGYPIKYFTDWIKEEEFIEEAGKADFFLSPLNLGYYSCGELTSGIVEVIRQGKPGIYPAGYLPDPNIKSSSIFYESMEELPDLLIKLMSDKNQRKKLSENAIINSEIYSLEKVAEKFSYEIKYYVN